MSSSSAFVVALLLSPSFLSPYLAGRLLLLSIGALDQLLGAKVEGVTSQGKAEGELLVVGCQCLAKSQALLNYNLVHLQLTFSRKILKKQTPVKN